VAVVGGPLRLYEVTMPSGVVATLKLNEADAARMGGIPMDEPMRGVDEASQEPESAGTPPATKVRTSRNKRRTASNKEGGGGG
jgi:hypothetical protein